MLLSVVDKRLDGTSKENGGMALSKKTLSKFAKSAHIWNSRMQIAVLSTAISD